MKNKIAIFASVLLIAASFAACGEKNNKGSDTSKAEETTTVTEAVTDDTESAAPDAVTTDANDTGENPGGGEGGPPEGGTQGGPPEKVIKEIPMDDAYLGKILDLTDKPTAQVKGDAAEADFPGKWECDVAVNGDTAYTSIFGIPLYASDRIEINEDKTGKIISTTGGKDGVSTTEKEFTWTVAEGTLTANIKGANDSTYQAAMHMSDDGRIMLISKARDGSDVSAYYKSVEDFSEFDFDSVNFDYVGLSE